MIVIQMTAAQLAIVLASFNADPAIVISNTKTHIHIVESVPSAYVVDADFKYDAVKGLEFYNVRVNNSGVTNSCDSAAAAPITRHAGGIVLGAQYCLTEPAK